MPYKRIAVAAAALLAATYLRFLMPAFYEAARPALREALEEEQVSITVPEAWEAWLRWD